MSVSRWRGRTPRRLVVVVLALTMIAVSCSRSSDKPTADASPTAAKSTPGSFGDLKGVCGPGNAKGATARGVTDTTISIATMGDPKNTFLPGLGQEFFDVATAFVKWCNDAGGVNGRKIELNTRDAKVLETGARYIEACQSDFMSVGGGNGLDEASVTPRVNCKLGQIPAFQASAKAVNSPLQVMPVPSPTNMINIGWFLAAARMFPSVKSHTAISTQNNATGHTTGYKNRDALTESGFTVIPTAENPSQVDNWRPYMEEYRSKNIELLVPLMVSEMSPFIGAMNDVGWTPKAIVGTSFMYSQMVRKAAAEVKFPPTWIGMTFWPFEIGDQNAATQQLMDLVKTVTPNPVWASFHESAMTAWLLWAKSATACGSNLTVDCVLANAAKEKAWTGGGLHPAYDLSAAKPQPSSCFVMMKLTSSGFVYDREATQPTKSIYNCNPQNVVQLTNDYSS